MKIKIFAVVALLTSALALPLAADQKLTQGQISAHRSLTEYGYRDVDVTKLSNTQLAQIHFLTGSDVGTGRIRGQIGAILRKSNVWDLLRK